MYQRNRVAKISAVLPKVRPASSFGIRDAAKGIPENTRVRRQTLFRCHGDILIRSRDPVRAHSIRAEGKDGGGHRASREPKFYARRWRNAITAKQRNIRGKCTRPYGRIYTSRTIPYTPDMTLFTLSGGVGGAGEKGAPIKGIFICACENSFAYETQREIHGLS